jgi:methionyl-tRNA synthetase
MIQFNTNDWQHIGEDDLLKHGHEIGAASLLFEKIEDDAIETQVNKLLETKKMNENQMIRKPAPQKDHVTYEDFSHMDIRVGTIIEAEKVAKTKKLMKLLIDTGIDKRTVVSGIAEFFTPEEVIGKQVSILVNLEPRNLKGIESQGMILMAEGADGKLTFVSPEHKIGDGALIK